MVAAGKFKKIFQSFNATRGQVLVEVLIGIVVGSLLLGAAAITIVHVLTAATVNRRLQTSSFLASELLDNTRAYANASWYNIYSLSHTSSTKYYLMTTSSPFSVVSGTETTSIDGLTYTRYFYVDNVSRDSCGSGNATSSATTTCSTGPGTSGVDDDPSTQKITDIVTWSGSSQEFTAYQYLARSRNQIFKQGDWSGGSGQEYFASTTDGTIVNNQFASSTNMTVSTANQLTMTATTSLADLYSSVYDTFQTNGAAPDTIMWNGSQPAGATVKFQIASASGAGGPWSYLGNDGTSASYYTPSGSGSQVVISKSHNNKRYIRFRIRLDTTGNSGATVNSVVFGWAQ